MPKSEKVILVDKNDKTIGFKEKKAAHKNPVPLHRAISVVIFDKTKNKMLIQQRSRFKETWPLFWSNTCCTHPLKGETYQKTAKRRLKEEMGFSTPLKEVFKFIYKAEYDQTWGEHELDAVFTGTYSGKINSDPKEVVNYKWVRLDDLNIDIKKNPNKYSPWFKTILKKLKI